MYPRHLKVTSPLLSPTPSRTSSRESSFSLCLPTDKRLLALSLSARKVGMSPQLIISASCHSLCPDCSVLLHASHAGTWCLIRSTLLVLRETALRETDKVGGRDEASKEGYESFQPNLPNNATPGHLAGPLIDTAPDSPSCRSDPGTQSLDPEGSPTTSVMR